ncbi:MAG: TolC family protein [Rubrivivax sp.]
MPHPRGPRAHALPFHPASQPAQRLLPWRVTLAALAVMAVLTLNACAGLASWPQVAGAGAEASAGLSGLQARSLLAPPEPPAHWQNASAADAAPPAANVLSSWWQRFNDPELSRVVQRAQQANPRAVAASAVWRQALAQRDAIAGARLPSLVGQGTAASDTQGLGAEQGSSQRVQLGLDLRWTPDLSGATAHALAAADAVAQSRQASLGDVQVALAAEAALAYVELRRQQRRLALAQQTLSSLQQTRQITQWRLDAGLLSTLQLDQARAAVAQTEALVPALQTRVAQSRHALALLMGEPYRANAAPERPSPASAAEATSPPAAAPTATSAGPQIPEAPDSLALHIPADTLRQRADVRATEQAVVAARSRVGQAQAERLPSLALGGSIGLSALALGALGDRASVVSSLLASISMPLFDGGVRRAQVRLQEGALDQALALHRAAVLSALTQVEDALVALAGYRASLVALDTAASAASHANTLAQQRFTGGLVDFQTVLDTQRTAYSAQDAALGARADLASSHVRLYVALGGGWRDGALPAAQQTASTGPR